MARRARGPTAFYLELVAARRHHQPGSVLGQHPIADLVVRRESSEVDLPIAVGRLVGAPSPLARVVAAPPAGALDIDASPDRLPHRDGPAPDADDHWLPGADALRAARSVDLMMPDVHAHPSLSDHLALTLICLGCAPIRFGSVTVRTPSRRSASISSASAPSGSVNERENAPYERSKV